MSLFRFFGEVEDEFTLAEEMALEELMHANDQGYFGGTCLGTISQQFRFIASI